MVQPTESSDLPLKLMREIEAMDGSVGYDAVIVCCSTLQQENFWQARLVDTAGQAARKGALIFAVHEDWAPDGAGNGLGTLYAYTKARAKAKAEGVDLDAKMKEGWSVAIFHTAGKGTRLAPLPGSENNNKPGVKLPSIVKVGGKDEQLTILESVIRQTNSYAPGRKGRCSVFWGDQIFVPSNGTAASGAGHADILACLGPMPTQAEWAEKGLEKYGLIAVNDSGEATQVEKVTYDQATDLLKSFGNVSAVGPSLGSFSVSAALMAGLLEEFCAELEAKAAKFDSDPDFWMPLSLSEASYVKIMSTKDVAEDKATTHFARMQAFKAKFMEAHPGPKMFASINVGTLEECYWWDYGMLKLYVKNNMLATAQTEEARALHKFMKITSNIMDSKVGAAVVDDRSVVLSSTFGDGKVTNCVCASVAVMDLDVEDCLLVNVKAKKVRGKGLVLYNVVDDSEEGICLADGDVRVNVYMPGRDKIVMKSNVCIDGGKVFKTKMDVNPYSYNEVYLMNGAVDVVEAKMLLVEAGEKLKAEMFPGAEKIL
mmetsp:Transcript_28372/g.47615  ORF Transcript_28372/g.47615 Transcript_28372/m.47615 type:complete len:541 (-) Transcript_28372:459-2081(-)|eukprot:CAMPEP_0198229744 /NCGR_PEP_ID=MMETSP1445-20131203/114282_1 /TAXON_ID=36898 /ORGANISM="Pyramimonas sp., Strain CCMP2087" /LENGTH=540 /DNA_ID=CAMNT_0043910217 /DNA_START=106 /DNA_END=1728 /DNA_ORIENTATION=-